MLMSSTVLPPNHVPRLPLSAHRPPKSPRPLVHNRPRVKYTLQDHPPPLGHRSRRAQKRDVDRARPPQAHADGISRTHARGRGKDSQSEGTRRGGERPRERCTDTVGTAVGAESTSGVLDWRVAAKRICMSAGVSSVLVCFSFLFSSPLLTWFSAFHFCRLLHSLFY